MSIKTCVRCKKWHHCTDKESQNLISAQISKTYKKHTHSELRLSLSACTECSYERVRDVNNTVGRTDDDDDDDDDDEGVAPADDAEGL